MLDVHCVILQGKPSWRLSRSTLGPAAEDVVCLRFSTAAFNSISQRDAYETMRAVLRHENVAWVQPSLDKWRLDMEGLSAVIGSTIEIPWLKGTISLKPEFKAEILSAGARKVGDGQFIFYISPDIMTAEPMPKRKEVFISYSHADKKWLERVRVHLRPLEKKGLLELFDDSKIKPGAKWKEELRTALDRAKVAVLLISADFIASDFIADNELPPLLKRAESGGARVIPVIVSPCGFHREKELSDFQSVNDPKNPLASLTYSQSEQILTELAEAVEEALNDSTRRTSAEGESDGATDDRPYGIPVPGKPHVVESPFSPGKFVDIEGFGPGAEVKDPYTGKIFKIP